MPMSILRGVTKAPPPIVLGLAYVSSSEVATSQGMGDPGALVPSGPEWLIGAVAGIWLVVWLLDKMGKLPTANVDRRRGPKFEDQDRHTLRLLEERTREIGEHLEAESARSERLRALLTFRSDDDGIERWLRHHQVTIESRNLMRRLNKLAEEVRSTRLEEARHMKAVLSTLENIQGTLAAMERRQGRLEESVEDVRKTG